MIWKLLRDKFSHWSLVSILSTSLHSLGILPSFLHTATRVTIGGRNSALRWFRIALQGQFLLHDSIQLDCWWISQTHDLPFLPHSLYSSHTGFSLILRPPSSFLLPQFALTVFSARAIFPQIFIWLAFSLMFCSDAFLATLWKTAPRLPNISSYLLTLLYFSSWHCH